MVDAAASGLICFPTQPPREETMNTFSPGTATVSRLNAYIQFLLDERAKSDK